MDFDGMSAAELRAVIEAAEQALSEVQAVEAARLAVVAAVQSYADAAGVTVDEAWTALSPATVAPEPPDLGGLPQYVKPNGAHDAYSVGDEVVFQGRLYRAVQNGVVWSPIEYPQAWTEVTRNGVVR